MIIKRGKKYPPTVIFSDSPNYNMKLPIPSKKSIEATINNALKIKGTLKSYITTLNPGRVFLHRRDDRRGRITGELQAPLVHFHMNYGASPHSNKYTLVEPIKVIVFNSNSSTNLGTIHNHFAIPYLLDLWDVKEYPRPKQIPLLIEKKLKDLKVEGIVEIFGPTSLEVQLFNYTANKKLRLIKEIPLKEIYTYESL
jgi:hypothetical protein